MSNDTSTWSSIERCCAVTQTRGWRPSDESRRCRITGQSLIASGRVPKINRMEFTKPQFNCRQEAARISFAHVVSASVDSASSRTIIAIWRWRLRSRSCARACSLR